MKLKIKVISTILLLCLSINSYTQNYSLVNLNLNKNYNVGDFLLHPNKDTIALLNIKNKYNELIPEILLYNLKDENIYSNLHVTQALHSWNNFNKLVLGNHMENIYLIINMNTLDVDTLYGLSDSHELLFIKKNEMLFHKSENQYSIIKNGISNEIELEKNIIEISYDKAKDKMIEIKFDSTHYYVQEYDYKTNKRKIITKIKTIQNIFVSNFKIYNNKLFYLKSIYGNEFEKLVVELCSIDLSSSKREKLYAFDVGIDCEKFDIISENKFILLLDNPNLENQLNMQLETEIEGLTIGINFTKEIKFLVRDKN